MIICVDTGFLLGLYDQSDQYHDRAKQQFTEYFEHTRNNLLVPWPILYETLSTRLVKNRPAMNLLENDWIILSQQRRLELLPDEPFRGDIIYECFAELRKHPAHARRLSLVDRVIRRMLSDVNVRIDAFITFNPSDFQDACRRDQQLVS